MAPAGKIQYGGRPVGLILAAAMLNLSGGRHIGFTELLVSNNYVWLRNQKQWANLLYIIMHIILCPI